MTLEPRTPYRRRPNPTAGSAGSLLPIRKIGDDHLGEDWLSHLHLIYT
jgi:hypothetical protein